MEIWLAACQITWRQLFHQEGKKGRGKLLWGVVVLVLQ